MPILHFTRNALLTFTASTKQNLSPITQLLITSFERGYAQLNHLSLYYLNALTIDILTSADDGIWNLPSTLIIKECLNNEKVTWISTHLQMLTFVYAIFFCFAKRKKNGATQNLSLFLLPPVVPNDLIWLRFLPSRSLNHLKDGGRYKKNFLQIFFCIYFFFFHVRRPISIAIH